MAVFSKLVPPFITAVGLQAAFAAYFVPRQNEIYYDLGGCLGFLSTTFISLYYPGLKAHFLDRTLKVLPSILSFAPRQLLLNAALGIWSTRLGLFLVTRALKAGGDSRFDQIKKSPRKFSYYWAAQAFWVFLVGLPVYLSNTLSPDLHPVLKARDYVALGLFAGSFLLEATADRQKSKWRAAKDARKHNEKFITSGLWSISRHPNYIGEIGIWTGIWALSTSGLQTPHFPKGTVALAAVSPVVAYLLTRKVSGVPTLERVGKKRFGDDPKYQKYISSVPVFWPWGGYNA